MKIKEQLLSYARHIPELAAIEVFFDDGELRLEALLLKRHGSRVEVLRRESGIQRMETLLERLPKGIPLVLALNGKGIIHRFVKKEDIKAESDRLRMVLPNAKKQDFYWQARPQAHYEVVSVARKDRLTEMMAPFEKYTAQLLSVHIGPFSLLPVLPFLLGDQVPASLAVGPHRFELYEDEIVGYQIDLEGAVDRIFRVGDEEMNGRFLVAFSLGMLTLGEWGDSGLELEQIKGNLEELHQQWLFKRTGIAMALFFLALLLFNTFFFLRYQGRVSESPIGNESLLEKEVARLAQRVKGQEQLAGIIHPAQRKEPWSYLADRIGASIPREISLEELSFFPKEEALSRKERRPVYQEELISLKGTTATIGTLNHWMKEMEMMDFNQEVKLVNYHYDEKQERGIFNLLLHIRP